MMRLLRTWMKNSFQFHKGTIRTDFLPSFSPTYSHFNSIKVRLELAEAYYNYQNTKFQFHKGTIRTCVLKQKIKQKKLFQFHKGTIRTVVPTLLDILISNFNSIKVRLELILLIGNILQPVHFNSIKVRLELMVIGFLYLLRKFQFHKGTIRTLLLNWRTTSL